MSLPNVTLAELSKLRTLRGVAATIAATVVCGVGLATLFAAATLRQPGAPQQLTASAAVDTSLAAIPYCQIGLIVLGIVTTASEYGGPQIRTTLASVPNRMTLLTGKVVAYLAVAAGTALTTVGTSVVATETALGAHRPPVSALRTAHHLGTMLGAAGYLVLIGLLAIAVAVLVRSFVATLVAMLTAIVVLSPVLAAITKLAAYLPDRAGALLYQSNPDPGGVLTPVQGAVVLGTWIVVLLGAAAVTFTARDA
ncbi:MAG TPA: hypothetical protein VGD84_12320 [Pseudonocardiaceae bacterium]